MANPTKTTVFQGYIGDKHRN